MSTRTLLSALCATTLAMPLWAQTETPAAAPAAPAPAVAPAVTVAGAEPTAKPASRDKDTLSVDFPDEDIKTILRNVADLFELNLVVPDTLVGKTSIKLRDVSWRQIFKTVLDPVNFTYVEEGNIIKIVSNELLQQEPGSTEVFILNNAKAGDIKPTIDGLIDAATGGKIVIDARSNSLVITERPSRMSRIRNIIEQLDKATDQVMIESKFVEVTDRDMRNMGVKWNGLQQTQIGVGGITQTWGRGREQTGSVTPGPETNAISTNNQSRVATAVFSASDFNVVLSALKTQNNTKIVSNPTIVTLNNSEATINIGQEFPVPSYTYNSERGSFEVSGFTYKPIGINLKVTPQVNARGLIRLNLEPEVSQQNGSTTFGGAGGASIPIVATRKVKTQVSLQDGQTMGIGGLITASLDHGGTKVPVLGSIPLLGRLFNSKSVDDSSTNLLIFITAKTLRADGATAEEVFDPRAIQATGMAREDLPGHRAAKGTDLFVKPEAEKEKGQSTIKFKDGSDLFTPMKKSQ